MNAPEHKHFAIPTLADKALLVKLQRSMYQPYAYDANATQLIEQTNGLRDVGKFNKRLFKDSLILKQTNEKFNLLYTTYLKHTVPWLDDGVRMVPNALYFEFAEEMRSLIAAAKAAADTLEANWDAMVQHDMVRLGPLAHSLDYPSAQEVRKKFNATINFFPIPSTDDFRIQVSEEDRQAMETAITNAEANVSKYLIKEMLAPIQAFVRKMAVPINTDGAVFRDTLVGNISELVDRLPRLNINQDVGVSTLIGEVRDVISAYAVNPDLLRDSPTTRQHAHDRMKEIESKMAAFMVAP